MVGAGAKGMEEVEVQTSGYRVSCGDVKCSIETVVNLLYHCISCLKVPKRINLKSYHKKNYCVTVW